MKRIILVIGIVSFIFLVGCNSSNNNNLFVTGTIEATEVNVASEIAGKVESIKIKEGDVVKGNQMLVTFENKIAENTVEQAKANLKVAQAKADEVTELKSGATDGAIAAANAGVDLAELALEAAKYQLGRYKISSPLKGTVNHININNGEWVNPGATLVSIADLDKLWINIYIPERELGKVKLGQSVTVKVDSFPNEIFHGKITKIANEAEFTPKNVQTKEERVKTVFAVKVSLDNSNGKLKPGMPADVEVAF